ncbi:MAG: hypothetical protein EHM61_15380, partial [Acidobacteria bacterium]
MMELDAQSLVERGIHERHGKPAVPRFAPFAWRVISLQMLTYSICGILAFFTLGYAEAFEKTDLRYLMLPTDSPW